MKMSEFLCGNGESDERVLGETNARSPRPAAQHAQEHILHGRQTPGNTLVEVHDTTLSATDTEAPALTIRSLRASVLNRLNKLPPIFRTGTRTLVDTNSTNVHMQPITSSQHIDSEASRPRSPMDLPGLLETASKDDHRTILLAEENMTERQEHQSGEFRPTDTVADPVPAPETVSRPDADSNPSSQGANETTSRFVASAHSAPGNAQNYVPTTFHDLSQVSWIGAAEVKAPQGESRALKIFYDSGSTDNMITKALAIACGFELRLILPDDLRLYEGVNSKFIPRYYVELELRDEEHGIKEYTRASFYVADTLGCWSLLAGRTFMYRHNLGLASLGSAHSLVLTAKAASKGTYYRFPNSRDS
jgi:hypothetical protein